MTSLPHPTAPASPRVCAVVLNWNGREDTLACLESLHRDPHEPLDVVVVDNGSSDGSREAVAARFPDVRWIQNPANLGIAHGFNQGIDAASALRADYVFFLNNDATVELGCLRSLVAAAEAMPEAGILAPLILETPGRNGRPPAVWYAGGSFSLFLGVPEHQGRGLPPPADDARTEAPRAVTFATGCALLVRRALFESVGRFDERFFAYAEDADLALRARAARFRIVYVPWARVRHQVGATIRRTSGEASRLRLATANLLRLERKHARWYHWPSFIAWFGSRWLAYLTLRHAIRTDLWTIRELWRGVAEGLRDSR
jgi:GT2 family glycosyltransferase